MADDKANHPSASFKNSGNSVSDGGSTSIGSNGASFTPASELAQGAEQAFANAKMRASLIRADAQTVGASGAVIGASRLGAVVPIGTLPYAVVGATGTVAGSTVTSVTVTSQHIAKEAWNKPAGDGVGTLFVGAGGEADTVTANVPNALAQATSGGVIDGATAVGGGTIIASSGGFLEAGDAQHNVSGGTVAVGGTLSATNGGTVVNGLISGSGSANVGAIGIGVPVPGQGGGSAVGTVDGKGTFGGTVAAAGTLNVGQGGQASGVVVSGFAAGINVVGLASVVSGGSAVVNVNAGGNVVSGQVDGYGTLAIAAGASGTNLTASGASGVLNYASSAYIDVQGTATTVTAQKYGTALAENGGIVSNAIAQAGGTILASNNGFISGATAQNSGFIVASNNGFISGAIADQGGEVDAGANGTLVNATAFDGGDVYASGGGKISGGTADPGGELLAESGGALVAGDSDHNIVGGTVGAGGDGEIYSGGTFAGGLVTGLNDSYGLGWSAGTAGIANVYSGGVASNISVYGNGALNVSGGGVVSGATLSGAYDGGALGAMATSGAPVLNVFGGSVAGGTVTGVGSFVAGGGVSIPGVGSIGIGVLIPGYSGVGATANLSAGGIASGLSVGEGGTINVGSGGVLSGGAVSGALSNVSITVAGVGVSAVAGGTALVNVSNGGVASHEVVSYFGTMNAGSGAKLTDDSAFGGTINIGAGASMIGGEASGTNDAGGKLGLGATTYYGVINVSGQQARLTNGIADAYGTVIAQSGATVIGGSAAYNANAGLIASSNGTILATSGYNVSNATAQKYGTVVALGGGVVANGTASNGGTVLASGGIVSGATAYYGGTLVASTHNGIISDGNVSSGGTGIASGGGLITGGQVNFGGTEIASDGGTVSGAVVWSSGQLHAENGGTVGGTVSAGGSIWANSGGLVSNATLFSGAKLNSPGAASGIWGSLFGTAIGTGLVSGAIYNSITLESGVILGMSSGSMSNATINGGAAIGIYSSGAYVSGATVYGDPKAGGASIDALNGGTVYAATAFSGGLVAAGGVGVISANGIKQNGDNQGTSLMSGALIESGGVGLVGGNKNLTVTKGGTQVTLQGAGISSDAVVDAGGLFDVNSQGTMLGGQVAGTLLVEDGGQMQNVLFSGAEANGYVDVGAFANNNTVESGAVMSFAGGNGFGNTVQAGGQIDVGVGNSRFLSVTQSGAYQIDAGTDLAHGVVTSTYVGSKGILSVGGGSSYIGKDGNPTNVTGGTAIAATVGAQGTMIIASGGYAKGAYISGGQDSWVSGIGIVDPTGPTHKNPKAIGDGAYVSDGGDLDNATIQAGGADKDTGKIELGGLIRVESGATVTDLNIGWYGQIEVIGVNYSEGETVSCNNGTITLVSGGKNVWSATLNSDYPTSGFHVKDDNGTAVIVFDTCFLKGTRISTPKGDVEVQNLKAGDSVWAMVDGKEVERKITATRRQKSQVNRKLPLDMAGWSVCVRAGAFGNNLPERDLRVTPEHCFYFEGRFLPVRMLVNGFSIYYDTSLEHFDFFHFETEPHSIVRAEGVLTESWLNTEERREAINLSNGITRLKTIPSRNWERDAAAPLDVSPVFAEKLWQQLNNRALNLGMDQQAHQHLVFDNNPNLRLRLDDGREIAARNRRGNKYFFQLPAGVKGASLLSKTFRPSETVGPWVDDRRQLGVLVGKIKIAIGDEFRDLDSHLRVANAYGWDVVENSPCRWTKGDALLPILGTEEELRGGASLIVEVLAGGPYPKDQKDGKKDNFSDASYG